MGYLRTIREWLELNRGVSAVWQLLDDGHTVEQVRAAVRGHREVHDGVYLSGHAPITDWQRWKAGTLTSYGTTLSDWSGWALFGLREHDGWPTTVKRLGSGGPVVYPARAGRLGSLKVARTTFRFREDRRVVDGIPVFTVPRLLVELSPKVGPDARARMVREVLRRKLATGTELRAQLGLHHGWRGTKHLGQLLDFYDAIPADRARSDAEVYAFELIKAAGFEEPALNVMVAGGEADLVSYRRRLIVELDGPQYHQFPMEDAIKQHRWEREGFVVRRLPTDPVYNAPHLLFAAWNDPVTAEERAKAAASVMPRLRP